MQPSNHTGNGIARCYNLTPAGSRLATYLDYCQSHPVTPQVRFADVPTKTEKERLEDELDQALDVLYNYKDLTDDKFVEARTRVKELRLRIYAMENPPVAPEPLLEPDGGYDDSEDDDPDDYNPYGDNRDSGSAEDD